MADRTITITVDTGHSSEVEISADVLADPSMQWQLAKLMWEEIERLLATPPPETTVQLEVGDG